MIRQTNKRRRPLVTIASTFYGDVDRRQGLHCAFATFDPQRYDAMHEARSWLLLDYIGRYGGIVVTDFDEQIPCDSAMLALSKVMAGEITLESLQSTAKMTMVDSDSSQHEWVRREGSRLLQDLAYMGGFSITNIEGDLVMRDKYEVGQAINVGPNAKAKIGTVNQQELQTGIDLSKLAGELEILRKHLTPQVSTAAEAADLGAVAEAEEAARVGDAGKVKHALGRARTWVLTSATAIGVPLAIEALKRSTGLDG
ncbi:hypothetical protein [Kribbella soli]|uniref:Uncharacterized protein n=1 Tax=Kribbella soli TaxID=1124743 RepID=A0A4V6N3J0_9ACTN|nr:hypothetical protein [Kribbella soli]TCC05466.1 hypothetical protein E0H45_25955 [Kribbella soli]